MIDRKLKEFLCEETKWEDLGNENLLHELPEFGKEVGAAINEDRLIDYTKELSGCLEEMDLYKASLLSNFIGFACEKEEDTSAGRGIVELFARSCTKVYEMYKSLETEDGCPLPEDMKEIYDKNSDWARAYYGFNILCVTTMAFITRDVALRGQLSDMGLEEQIRYLTEETDESPYLASIRYVNLMQSMCSDFKFLVLFPKKNTGFLASANDLNNCFHLLFLLEEQIYEKLAAKYGMKEFHASDSLKSLAHGDYPDDCWEQSYFTYFMECNYAAAWYEKFDNDLAMLLIWGEMPPDAIPRIDGRGVIVLMDTGINRGFSPNFLAVPHSALNPYVEIERELSDEEYEAWIGKIRSIKHGKQ